MSDRRSMFNEATRVQMSALVHLTKLGYIYKERTGHYPGRVLVDQIYRTRDNQEFCRKHGIQMSGPKLGRPKKDEKKTKPSKAEYQDNTDRIEAVCAPDDACGDTVRD